MINIRYVNNISPLYTESDITAYENDIESCYHEIENDLDNLSYIETRYTMESMIYGDSTTVYLTESEKKNIFTKIGEALIKAGKIFVEAIQKIIEKIKNIGFKSKTDLEKLEELKKKNPSLVNEIQVQFDNGALDLADIKSLKELNSAWDDIYKLSKRADVDEKTLRGKWNKAMDKFDKDSKSWGVVKVATATTAVVGAIVAVKTLIPKCKEAQQKATELERSNLKDQQDLLKILEKENPNAGTWGKYRFLLEANRAKQGKTLEVCKNRVSILQTLQNKVASAIDKVTGKTASRYRKSLEFNDKILSKKEEAELKTHAKKAEITSEINNDAEATYKSGYNRQMGSLDASDDHYPTPRALDKEAKVAAAKQEGIESVKKERKE